jgi:adenylate cyclase
MAQENGRRLAAIMFTDVVGYSRLSARDEALSLELLNEHREIVRRTFPLHGGREIKVIGDGFFIEFTSIVEAVHCAVTIQTALFERNLSVEEEKTLQIRIGIHLGDVVDFEEDSYGNEVNIAARIEPFAKPGGISVSQQVVDQIRSKVDLPLFKLGRIRLKNIENPIAIWRIVLPWEPKSLDLFRGVTDFVSRRFRRGGSPSHPNSISPQGALVGLQVFGILILLGSVLMKLLHPVSFVVDRGPARAIASVERTPQSSAQSSGQRRLYLPDSWQYARGSDEESTTLWRPFYVSKTLSYANELQGDYLLKLVFTGAGGFRHPAMVLGLVSDAYRIYLNGKFIGGSQRFSDLALASFDPALIKPGLENTVLVKAWTRQSLSPGINLLPSIPPMIGEFEDVSEAVSSSHISFHVMRSIYLAVSLLIAITSLGYCMVRRTDLKYLYFSGFLLLGSLGLAYYNTFVASALSYSFYRYIKLISLGLSSLFLFSTYLHLRGLKRLETANNLAGITLALVSAFQLLGSGLLPSEYVDRYNEITNVIVAYSAVWIGLLAIRGCLKFSKPVELRSITGSQMFEVSLIFVFGTVVALLCYSSLMDGQQSGIFASFLQRTRFKSVAMAYPFFFALMVLATGLVDYAEKSRSISYKRKKDDLILGIADLAVNCPDMEKSIGLIQSKVAEFLQASRSTIYLSESSAESSAESGFLKATFIHGPVGVKERIKKVLEPRTGIIGYCMGTRSAILVENISRDPRFRNLAEIKREKVPSYRTGSFMVFPLLLGSRLLGVITVADRFDSRPFTREDFCLMHLVSKDLAFVISHAQLQQELKQKTA